MDVRKEYFRLKELSMHSTGEDCVRADEALEHFLNGLNEADKEIVFKAIEEDFASLHRTAHEARELKILADSIGDLGQRLSALSDVIHRNL